MYSEVHLYSHSSNAKWPLLRTLVSLSSESIQKAGKEINAEKKLQLILDALKEYGAHHF